MKKTAKPFFFKNKVIILTGGSSGIGAILASELAAAGAIPILVARSEAKLKEVSMKIEGRHEIIAADVTSTDEVNQVVTYVLERYKRIDFLINNAGFGVFDTVTQASIDTIENMMNVNYLGMVRFTKSVLPSMLIAGHGGIINIGSLAGKIGSAKSSGYSATKHAVLGFTKCLRQELVGTGVKISAINPGPIDTPFFDQADPSGAYIKNIRWMMLKPEQVTFAIRKAMVNGQAEIDLPWFAAAAAKLYQLFPRLFDSLAYKLLNRK